MVMYNFSIAADDSCALERDMFLVSFISYFLTSKGNFFISSLINLQSSCYLKAAESCFVRLVSYRFHVVLKTILPQPTTFFKMLPTIKSS
jgi:hypothetical protein